MANPTWEDHPKHMVAKQQFATGSVFQMRVVKGKVIHDPRRTLASAPAPTHKFTVEIPPPVRVITVNGEEQLNYRPAEMAENKIYPVKWNGENHALRKSGEKVELLVFHPLDDG